MGAILGLLLLTGAIREFEPYRFHIVLQFLLLEGFVGDFFFMDTARGDPWTVYLLATGCHLLLLMGSLMKGRDRLPGQAQNRFERLGGFSLWILVPLILWFGTPIIARSLREVLPQLTVMLGAVAGLAVLAALLFEQWLIPWHLWRPGERFRGAVRAVTGVGVALLPIWAMAVRTRTLWQQQDGGAAAWCFILTLPLIWMVVHSVLNFKARSAAVVGASIDDTPSRRLRLVHEREQQTVEIDFRWRHRWKWITVQGLFLVVPAAAAAVAAGRGGDAPAMVLALTSALFGPAVTGLFWDALSHRMLIQVRNGYCRCGIPILGGVFRGGRWHRRLAIAPHLRNRLSYNLNKKAADRPFNAAEQSWLNRLIDSDGQPSREDWDVANSLKLKISGQPQSVAGDCIRLPLSVTNAHPDPFSLADLESSGSPFAWQAKVNGQTADVYFGNLDRERSIASGQTARLTPRLYLPTGMAANEKLAVVLSFKDHKVLQGRLAMPQEVGS